MECTEVKVLKIKREKCWLSSMQLLQAELTEGKPRVKSQVGKPTITAQETPCEGKTQVQTFLVTWAPYTKKESDIHDNCMVAEGQPV